ncbi:MAG: hypothetical protein ACP5E5_02090 [Acidobacteriaceae bacterium]
MISMVALGAAAQTPAGVDPVALVRRAIQLRLQEEKNHRPVAYVLRKQDGDHETTKEVVETRDGDVARLIAINGQALNAEQEQAELSRLQALSANPGLQQKRRSSEQRDAARIDHLVALLPESEIYQMAGMVPCGAAQCYRLSFTPNPKFDPPDFEAEVLEGFAGEIWIDASRSRLVRLEAHLVRDVNIGFGILGRVDKGGTILLEQSYESDAEQWQPSVLKMNLQGRALMVKPVKIEIDERATEFKPVAEMGYREAITLLERPGVLVLGR